MFLSWVQGNKGGGGGQGKRRPQRGMEDKVLRTVYISSIDLKVRANYHVNMYPPHLDKMLSSIPTLLTYFPQVTEAELATFFMDCGRVVDCRICGDPNSATRFAFIEFVETEGAEKVGRDR